MLQGSDLIRDLVAAERELHTRSEASIDAAVLDALDDLLASAEYNGWTNYPTWAVNLWLQNDEGLYRETMEIVDGQHNPDDGGPRFRQNVADALRRYVQEDLTPELGASFASDLLNYALSQVDWQEIADAWIEMAVQA